MKKRTLNQTWVLCLRMWRWIAKTWVEGMNIDELKKQWVDDNGFGSTHCFFCSYCDQIDGTCASCPGRLIDYSFSCSNNNYHYKRKPAAFYKELLRLNRIRKGS